MREEKRQDLRTNQQVQDWAGLALPSFSVSPRPAVCAPQEATSTRKQREKIYRRNVNEKGCVGWAAGCVRPKTDLRSASRCNRSVNETARKWPVMGIESRIGAPGLGSRCLFARSLGARSGLEWAGGAIRPTRMAEASTREGRFFLERFVGTQCGCGLPGGQCLGQTARCVFSS